jgi:hypothetical protein
MKTILDASSTAAAPKVYIRTNDSATTPKPVFYDIPPTSGATLGSSASWRPQMAKRET